MSTTAHLASRPFWLDGGYDRDCVEACSAHPAHDWWEFRLGDVLLNPRDPDERMVVCRRCYVPRCGETMDQCPCILPRHHTGDHHLADGWRRKAGG